VREFQDIPGSVSRSVLVSLLTLCSLSLTWAQTLPPTAQLVPYHLSLGEALSPPGLVTIEGGTLFPDEPICLLLEAHNNTEVPIEILSVHTDCGCTRGEIPRSAIDPGETDHLLLHFEMTGRIGPQLHTVMCELRRPDRAETYFLTLEILMDIRRDIALEHREMWITCNPVASGEIDTFQSLPVRIVISENPIRRACAGTTVTPLTDPPPGVSLLVTSESDGDADGAFLRLLINRERLESSSRSFDLPLRIRILNAEGEVIADVRRNLHVNIKANVQLRIQPEDTFLGILRMVDCPIHRSYTLSLNPLLPFRLLETRGDTDFLHWEVTPLTPDQEMCISWQLNLTIEEMGTIGGHFQSLPMNLRFSDETGEWEQDFDLEFQWVSVR
jgi:Protein of unknown function (DUF1573)